MKIPAFLLSLLIASLAANAFLAGALARSRAQAVQSEAARRETQSRLDVLKRNVEIALNSEGPEGVYVRPFELGEKAIPTLKLCPHGIAQVDFHGSGAFENVTWMEFNDDAVNVAGRLYKIDAADLIDDQGNRWERSVK